MVFGEDKGKGVVVRALLVQAAAGVYEYEVGGRGAAGPKGPDQDRQGAAAQERVLDAASVQAGLWPACLLPAALALTLPPPLDCCSCLCPTCLLACLWMAS